MTYPAPTEAQVEDLRDLLLRYSGTGVRNDFPLATAYIKSLTPPFIPKPGDLVDVFTKYGDEASYSNADDPDGQGGEYVIKVTDTHVFTAWVSRYSHYHDSYPLSTHTFKLRTNPAKGPQ
jgi:hypothetical protein